MTMRKGGDTEKIMGNPAGLPASTACGWAGGIYQKEWREHMDGLWTLCLLNLIVGMAFILLFLMKSHFLSKIFESLFNAIFYST